MFKTQLSVIIIQQLYVDFTFREDRSELILISTLLACVFCCRTTIVYFVPDTLSIL